VERVSESWSRRDYATALGLIDPDIEIEVSSGGVGTVLAGNYRGHAGLSKLLEDFWGEFEHGRTEVEECIPAGDNVFASVRHHGRGKTSGAEVETQGRHVWTVRDGKAVRWRLFASRDDALEAAGLQEGGS
jgi:ketosteroid isomerase-like protein